MNTSRLECFPVQLRPPQTIPGGERPQLSDGWRDFAIWVSEGLDRVPLFKTGFVQRSYVLSPWFITTRHANASRPGSTVGFVHVDGASAQTGQVVARVKLPMKPSELRETAGSQIGNC